MEMITPNFVCWNSYTQESNKMAHRSSLINTGCLPPSIYSFTLIVIWSQIKQTLYFAVTQQTLRRLSAPYIQLADSIISPYLDDGESCIWIVHLHRGANEHLYIKNQTNIFHKIAHWLMLTSSLGNKARVSGLIHRSCFSLDSLCFPQSGRQCFRGLPQSLAGAEAQPLFGMKRYCKAGCSNWSLHLQPPASEAAGLWCWESVCMSVCVCACIWFPQWTLGHCTIFWSKYAGGDPSCSDTFSVLGRKHSLLFKKEGFLAMQISPVYFDLISSGPKRIYPDKGCPSGSMRRCHSRPFIHPEAAAFFMSFSHFTLVTLSRQCWKAMATPSVLSRGEPSGEIPRWI